MSLEGGLIDDISFKKHKQNLKNNLNVEFLNPAQTENGFYVETGWTSIGNKIKVIKKIFVPNSLGSLYTMICQFIGYKKYGDEGKIMGLAPYGNNTYKSLFDDIVSLKGTKFNLNQKYFNKFGSSKGVQINAKGEAFVDNHYSKKIINLHPSLLPKYGGKGMYGKNVHKAVLKNNDRVSGISIHFVNENYDEGEIIAQKKCHLSSNETVDSLEKKIHARERVSACGV